MGAPAMGVLLECGDGPVHGPDYQHVNIGQLSNSRSADLRGRHQRNQNGLQGLVVARPKSLDKGDFGDHLRLGRRNQPQLLVAVAQAAKGLAEQVACRADVADVLFGFDSECGQHRAVGHLLDQEQLPTGQIDRPVEFRSRLGRLRDQDEGQAGENAGEFVCRFRGVRAHYLSPNS